MNESIRVVISDADFSGLAGRENLADRIKEVVRAELAANRASSPANQAGESTNNTEEPTQPNTPASSTGSNNDVSDAALAEVLKILGDSDEQS